MCKENNGAWSVGSLYTVGLKIWNTYVSSFLEGGVDVYVISFIHLHFKIYILGACIYRIIFKPPRRCGYLSV